MNVNMMVASMKVSNSTYLEDDTTLDKMPR